MRLLLLGDAAASDALSEPAVWIGELVRRWGRGGHRVQMIGAPPLDPAAVPWQPPEGIEASFPSEDDWEARLGEALGDRPEIVHVFGAAPFGPRVIEALREQPLILDVHDFWPICPRSDLLRQPGYEACPEHHPFAGCGPCAGLPRLRTMESRAELAAAAHTIVSHCAAARERLEAGLGRPVERIEYGVDPLRFRPDPEPPRLPALVELFEQRDRPRILFLGPPTPARGGMLLLDLLVAVQARLPEAELVIAGRDPEEPEWERMFQAEATELGLADRVRSIPRVPSDDLPALYASCAVAIAPGTGIETGLFLLQAMSSGVPVVAHEGPSQKEWIEHGEDGILVDSHDVAAFAAATAALLIDPMARSAFAEAARLRTMERHDLERSVFALEELYRRIREASRPPAAA